MTATEVRGLDHAFFFTLRDSVNFGDKDHMLFLWARSTVSTDIHCCWVKLQHSELGEWTSQHYLTLTTLWCRQTWLENPTKSFDDFPSSMDSSGISQPCDWLWPRLFWKWCEILQENFGLIRSCRSRGCKMQHEAGWSFWDESANIRTSPFDRNCSGLLPDLIIFF